MRSPAHDASLKKPSLSYGICSPPPVVSSIQDVSVSVIWQNLQPSDVLAMLSGIDVPTTGVFIDYQQKVDQNGPFTR
ncbi:hypothetical protein [Pseudomonas sp. B21-048]|uniref:hypothetical protein n=1 Tax=Pseudomonas sp. B21-048 TaxID=2895490 RepID=UPI002160F6C4|nr:hypothetical protein [Pseudomonas sp. B21-048]UVL00761.1 hypothetical protein LOY56_10570 [Pseudomonas sp. B21-048]